MANDSQTVRRTVQFKFTLPTANSSHLASLLKSAAPFYEAFGGRRMRLLQNVDDPARFVHEIEYETHEVIELNRQRVASDPRMQAYLQTWRSLLPGCFAPRNPAPREPSGLRGVSRPRGLARRFGQDLSVLGQPEQRRARSSSKQPMRTR